MKKKIIIYIALIFFSFAWGRTFWIFFLKLAPAHQMQYTTSFNNARLWKSKSFPHTRAPFIIDKDSIWKLSQYNYPTYSQHKQKTKIGFIRFDMNNGNANMNWELGESYITIEGALIKNNRDLIILWRDKDRKTMLSTLLYKGGVQHHDTLPEKGKFQCKGIALVKDTIQLAGTGTTKKATTIYSYIGSNKKRWTKRILLWPKGNYPNTTQMALTFYKENRWHTLCYIPPKYSNKKNLHTIRPFLITEKKNKTVQLDNIKISRFSYSCWLDKTIGNFFNYRTEENTLYQLKGKQLTKLKPGPFASKASKLRLNFLSGIFQISPTGLTQIHKWTTASYRKSIFVINGKELLIEHKSTARARNIRLAVHLSKQKIKSAPLVESFRFTSSEALFPSSDNGYWLLGVFGKYIKLNNNLQRSNTPGFWARLARVIDTYGSREAQYYDFYLEAAIIKKIIMPFFLFGLPIIWLLFPGIPAFKKEKQSRLQFVKQKLFSGAVIYTILFTAGFYWFWLISMNF